MSWGAWLIAWIEKARELYPDDLEAQARFVRRQAIAKRNETTKAAIERTEPREPGAFS